MNRIKLYLVLTIFAISSLFAIKGIYGRFTMITNPKVNTFSVGLIAYNITYVPNNGDSSFTEQIVGGGAISTFPDIEYNDCSSGTGSYQALGCTYVYEFVGWYTEPSFVNKVDETFIPAQNITLYAKWNKVYFAEDGPVVFDGDDIIDTGIKLFNQENAGKDFIVTFTVDSYTGYNPNNNKDKRATIFTNMDEQKDPYYGVQFFRDNTNYAMNVNASSAAANRIKDYNTGYVTGQKVIIKRENGVVYYSYDDGLTYTQTVNFSSFTSYFDTNATFGGGYDKNGNTYRFLIGTLSDMSIEIIKPKYYYIHFDPNGGTGIMPNQEVDLGSSPALTTNTFTMTNAAFGGWNTASDGSGTTYPDNFVITSDLANENETITLYAQWIPITHYYVHFDANGGTGTMTNQFFTYDTPSEPLTANTYTRANYEFRGWNTAQDGTGTHYDDEEAVRNLSMVDNDVVTLYAEWWKIQFIRSGDVVFDGTSNTFIDTGVNIFSDTNINKDFEIRFTFKSVDSDQMAITQGSPKQPTIFNAKDESNSNYPGINIRFNGNTTSIIPTYRWGGSSTQNISNILTSNAPYEFIWRRTTINGDKVITFQYKYAGYDSGERQTINQSSWSLNQTFATNVAFGGYFDSGNNPGRFFKGTLADLIILMDD